MITQPPESPFTRHKKVIFKAQSWKSVQILAHLAQLRKKIFLQSWCMRRGMRQFCERKNITRNIFCTIFALAPMFANICAKFASFMYIWHKLDLNSHWKLGSWVVRVADFRIEIPGSNQGSDFFSMQIYFCTYFFAPIQRMRWHMCWICKKLLTLKKSTISTHRVLT